jgi:hypothetical protein
LNISFPAYCRCQCYFYFHLHLHFYFHFYPYSYSYSYPYSSPLGGLLVVLSLLFFCTHAYMCELAVDRVVTCFIVDIGSTSCILSHETNKQLIVIQLKSKTGTIELLPTHPRAHAPTCPRAHAPTRPRTHTPMRPRAPAAALKHGTWPPSMAHGSANNSIMRQIAAHGIMAHGIMAHGTWQPHVIMAHGTWQCQ